MSFDDFDLVVPKLTNGALLEWTTQTFKEVVFTKEVIKDIVETSVDQKIDIAPSVEPSNKSYSIDQFYSTFVERSAQQCLSEALAPQRSKEWHDARRFCITASNFGTVVGHNPYCSPTDALVEKLWASFQGSESTAYGTFHEPDAAQSLLKALKKTSWLNDVYPGFTSYKFFESGLLKSCEQPWMAVSPDGFLAIEGPQGLKLILIEFKCPASQRDSELHPYRKSPKNVPVYYMDQIQGIMGLLNKFPHLIGIELERHGYKNERSSITEAFFVVWQPTQMHVTRVPYDTKYYNGYLEPELKKWHTTFIELATEKANGRLVKNTLDRILFI